MNYYNEWDPQAAAWLRELIQNKLIPDGDVDTRSICDVKPEELQKYTQCHFFAGIGGWARAFQLAGFPADRPAWTGSCPCQPFSAAGRKKGVNDERHLWPVFARLIAQCRPPVVFGEQVASAEVVGLAGEKEDVQLLQDRETVFRIFRELKGKSSNAVQRMLEQKREAAKKGESNRSSCKTQTLEGRKPWTRISECGEAQSEVEGDSVRHNTRGDSIENRQWGLRIDGDSIRLDNTKSMECSVSRSDSSGEWLHQGEHTGGLVCPERDGECVGAEFDSESGGCDYGTEENEIESAFAEIARKIGEKPVPVWLDGVHADMEKEGYAVGACVLGAHSVGAPHRRQRLYWVAENTLADANHIGRQPGYGKEGGERGEVWFRSGVEFGNCGKNCSLADMQQQGLEGHARDVHDRNESRRERTQTTGPVTKSGNSICMGNARSGRLHGNHGRRTGEEFTHRHTWDDVRIVHCRDGKRRRVPIESSICWMVDGLSQGVDIDWVRHAIETSFPVCKNKTYKNTRTDLLRGYGNAIVPQVAAEFVAAWMEVHQ